MAYELKDLLVSMRLPGEEDLKPATPAAGFSPDAQAELLAKLARCEAMLVENEITSRTARTGRRVK